MSSERTQLKPEHRWEISATLGPPTFAGSSFVRDSGAKPPFSQKGISLPTSSGNKVCSVLILKDVFCTRKSEVLHQIHASSRVTHRLTTWSSCTSYTQRFILMLICGLENYPCFGWGAQTIQRIIPALQTLTKTCPSLIPQGIYGV